MKTIIFIRTAPYNYKLPGKSLYQSLDEIGQQIANPSILKPAPKIREKIELIVKKYKPNRVFCSTFNRSQETACLFSKKITITSQLDEINFSMRDFSEPEDLSADKFDKKIINRIRHQFSIALIDNKLQEKQKDITKRLADFKKNIDDLGMSETVLCCSHGFIMKLFQNFFLSVRKLNDFKRLVIMYNWKKPPFAFLSGFVILGDKNSFHVSNFS